LDASDWHKGSVTLAVIGASIMRLDLGTMTLETAGPKNIRRHKTHFANGFLDLRGIPLCDHRVGTNRPCVEAISFSSCLHGNASLGTVTVILARFFRSSAPPLRAHPSFSCIQAGRPAGMSSSGIGTRSPSWKTSPYSSSGTA